MKKFTWKVIINDEGQMAIIEKSEGCDPEAIETKFTKMGILESLKAKQQEKLKTLFEARKTGDQKAEFKVSPEAREDESESEDEDAGKTNIFKARKINKPVEEEEGDEDEDGDEEEDEMDERDTEEKEDDEDEDEFTEGGTDEEGNGRR